MDHFGSIDPLIDPLAGRLIDRPWVARRQVWGGAATEQHTESHAPRALCCCRDQGIKKRKQGSRLEKLAHTAYLNVAVSVWLRRGLALPCGRTRPPGRPALTHSVLLPQARM